MISAVNNNLNYYSNYSTGAKVSFGKISSNSNSQESDCYDKKSKKSDAAKIALGTTSAIGVAAYSLYRARLGKILKSVGSDLPKTVLGRLKKLSSLTTKDGLTGLNNKSVLLTSLKNDVAEALEKNENFSVAMLDMDNFKGINEIFSHSDGDFVLKRIATNIQDVAEKYDLQASRYGGEEFTVMGKNIEPGKFQSIVEEINENIQKDSQIQDLKSLFFTKAENEIAFLEPNLRKLKDIFNNFHYPKHLEGNEDEFAAELNEIITDYIKQTKPSNRVALESFLKKLDNASTEQLRTELLNLSHQITPKTTLGNELDNIYKLYDSQQKDIEKWVTHLQRHGKFTISAGFADLKSVPNPSDSKQLLKVADAALNAAKIGGKNRTVRATEEIVNNVINS